MPEKITPENCVDRYNEILETGDVYFAQAAMWKVVNEFCAQNGFSGKRDDFIGLERLIVFLSENLKTIQQ